VIANIDLWPVAIIQDRYMGSYSKGEWLAIADSTADYSSDLGVTNRVDWCLLDGPHGDDVAARIFWSSPPAWIAVGNTPNEALDNLIAKN
jgi:hypothetical protein